MTYTFAQKNRWNRFRRNRPKLGADFQRASDYPILLHEMWVSLGVSAKYHWTLVHG